MQKVLTVASVPGAFDGGYADWGRLSRAEIIKRTCAVAAHKQKLLECL